MTLSDEDMTSWMNAYSALWHPAVLWGAAGPPRVEIPFDYEEPEAHHVYAAPESPPTILPEDWEERVRNVKAVYVQGTTERASTLDLAKQAYANMPPAPLPEMNKAEDSDSEQGQTTEENPAGEDQTPREKPSAEENAPPETGASGETSGDGPEVSPEEVHARLLALEPEKIKPFLAMGVGYLLLASLSEAMEHENLLETDEFWEDIQRSIAELAGVPYPAAEKSGETHSARGEAPPFDAEPPAEEDQSMYGYPPDDGAYEDYTDYESGSSRRSSFAEEDAEPWYGHLRSAAMRLLSAREVLYPVTIYLVDLFIPEENHLDVSWPFSGNAEIPLNVIASGALLEKLQQEKPELWQTIKEKVEKDLLEVCGGCYLEREDNLLPQESQLWNLLKGGEVSQKLLGQPIEVFARKRYYAHPQLPLFLSSAGYNRALMLTLDEYSALPNYQTTVVSWPSPDGKVVDAFVRTPYKADSLETAFNLGNYLHKTIREDHSATLAFLHSTRKADPWLEDFQELSRFGPIYGEWMTFTRYFNEVMAGEHTAALNADDFHIDHLSERARHGDHHTPHASPYPVSAFADHQRLRRQIDACWTLAAMHRGLAGKNDPLHLEEELAALEDQVEITMGTGESTKYEGQRTKDKTRQSQELAWHGGAEPRGEPEDAETGVAEQNCLQASSGTRILETEQKILQTFAERLLAQATSQEPGYLFVNPCSYKRRVALELEKPAHPLPVEDPIKACQVDNDKLRVVLELPALGFAWIPRSGPAGTSAPKMRMKLADDRHVRNEFFEVEIDPKTGGMASIADRRTQMGRMAQRLVFNPGSVMKATCVKATSVGPALGEVVAEGEILGEQQQLLARFRQRFRAWAARPILELRIEIYPEQPAAGYPWHAYFGSRFAWLDERSLTLRGCNGTSYLTMHPRPQSPDFLEVRGHRQNTVIFPGGLPFFTRQENRMVDLILMPEGESARVFDIAIGLEREYPSLTAQGLVSPVPMIPVEKGPPHIGATGWLYHLDMPNLILTSMRPGGREILYPDYQGENQNLPDLTDAITLRLFECGSQSDQAEFRCVRNPYRSTQLDARGERVLETGLSGDTVFLEVSPGDFTQLQIEFSERQMD